MKTTAVRDQGNVRVGATIKALRQKDGWNLGEFAAAVDITHGYMSNIEAGRKPCTPQLARRIADLLGVPLVAIRSGEINPERSLSAALTSGFESLLKSQYSPEVTRPSGAIDRIKSLVKFGDGNADLDGHLTGSALWKLHLAEFVLDPERVEAFEEFLADVTHDFSPCSLCGASTVGDTGRSTGGDSRPSTDQANVGGTK